MLDSGNLENDLSLCLVSSKQQVWLGSAACFPQETHQRTWGQSLTLASSAARAAHKLQTLWDTDQKNKRDVPSALQAAPERVHMVDGMHVLPVNVFFKTSLNNSYSCY